MSETQNITVRLDKAVLQKARVLAARRGTSISALVSSSIEKLAQAEDAYGAAMEQALSDLDRGLPLGGPPYLSRDAAHDH